MLFAFVEYEMHRKQFYEGFGKMIMCNKHIYNTIIYSHFSIKKVLLNTNIYKNNISELL